MKKYSETKADADESKKLKQFFNDSLKKPTLDSCLEEKRIEFTDKNEKYAV